MAKGNLNWTNISDTLDAGSQKAFEEYRKAKMVFEAAYISQARKAGWLAKDQTLKFSYKFGISAAIAPLDVPVTGKSKGKSNNPFA